jgi:hypothetical protein
MPGRSLLLAVTPAEYELLVAALSRSSDAALLAGLSPAEQTVLRDFAAKVKAAGEHFLEEPKA